MELLGLARLVDLARIDRDHRARHRPCSACRSRRAARRSAAAARSRTRCGRCRAAPRPRRRRPVALPGQARAGSIGTRGLDAPASPERRCRVSMSRTSIRCMTAVRRHAALSHGSHGRVAAPLLAGAAQAPQRERDHHDASRPASASRPGQVSAHVTSPTKPCRTASRICVTGFSSRDVVQPAGEQLLGRVGGREQHRHEDAGLHQRSRRLGLEPQREHHAVRRPRRPRRQQAMQHRDQRARRRPGSARRTQSRRSAAA